MTLPYPDTVTDPSRLQIYSLNPATGEWNRDFDSVVDTINHVVTGNTPHFSLFALLSSGVAAAANLSTVR
ncbi:MAG: hypothetical protein AAB385_08995, partial [Planctomycetota bacterium]